MTGSQGTIGMTTTNELAAICGFTLKIDNEIVGLTKHRDHTHARVCSRCLWPNKEGKQFLERSSSGVALFGEKTRDFFLVEKRKRLTLFFLFFQRKDPLSLAFLSYLISFLRSKVTHTGSILEAHSASNAHTLLVPMGIDPHLSRLVTSITKQSPSNILILS